MSKSGGTGWVKNNQEWHCCKEKLHVAVVPSLGLPDLSCRYPGDPSMIWKQAFSLITLRSWHHHCWQAKQGPHSPQSKVYRSTGVAIEKVCFCLSVLKHIWSGSPEMNAKNCLGLGKRLNLLSLQGVIDEELYRLKPGCWIGSNLGQSPGPEVYSSFRFVLVPILKETSL